MKHRILLTINMESKVMSISPCVKIDVALVKKSVMKWSRFKKLNHFYSLCDLNSNVLDVGVSNNEHNDQVNLFLNKFRLDPNQYTGLAIQPMNEIAKKHPGKKFVQYPGGVFPFGNKKFDWVFSNAVIEHVGSEEDQIIFINEMLRVGKNVFFTTPNKYFPIESHTNTFFRHWLNKRFYEWCKQNHLYWNENNLILLGFNDVKRLMAKSNANSYFIQKNRILGWPMTFTVVYTN